MKPWDCQKKRCPKERGGKKVALPKGGGPNQGVRGRKGVSKYVIEGTGKTSKRGDKKKKRLLSFGATPLPSQKNPAFQRKRNFDWT